MHRTDWHKKIVRLFLLALVAVVIALFLFLEGTNFDRQTLTTMLYILLTFTVVLIAVNISQYYDIRHFASQMAKELVDDMVTDSEDLFSALYKHSPVPYLLVEVDGTVSSTNFSALRLFNMQVGTLDGKNIFAQLADDNRPKVSMFPHMLENGIFISDEEVKLNVFDGPPKWVLFSLFSFVGKDGKRHGLLTLVDITKRKEVDKVKSEFVSLASHQLLTPVSALKWNLELLRSEEGAKYSPVQIEYMQKLERILGRMNDLVHDFLNVSRLELGRFNATKADMDLAELLQELERAHDGALTERALKIDMTIDPDCTTLYTDRKLFRMVLDNLISNAIKYSHKNSTIKIRTHQEKRATCMVTVTDTGIGIPVDEQDQIFSKIFRASNAHEHGSKGTGLGLYTAREIMRVLGGTITFTSKEGSGTTFTVTIPTR